MVCGVEEVMDVAEETTTLDEMVRALTSMAVEDDGRGLRRADPNEKRSV
jgi:hypothetical protein